MERQARRRDSRGCVDDGAAWAWAEEGGPDGAGAVRLLRSVSGRPGADGAPFEGCGRQIGMEVVFVVVVGCEG